MFIGMDSKSNHNIYIGVLSNYLIDTQVSYKSLIELVGAEITNMEIKIWT